jgi:septal ring factor EnvC (AmiA/AmiB activator)
MESSRPINTVVVCLNYSLLTALCNNKAHEISQKKNRFSNSTFLILCAATRAKLHAAVVPFSDNMSQSDAELAKKYQSICRELEDKEKDLVLSAQIGKELLEKNSKLEDRIYDLETDLKAANENIEQLSYQLSQKNDLINVLTSDECGSENGEQ